MRTGNRLSSFLCLRILLVVNRVQVEQDAWNAGEAIFGKIVARHDRTREYDIAIPHDLLQPIRQTGGGWRIVVNRADTFNVLDKRLLWRARCFRFRHRDPFDRFQQMFAYLVLLRRYGQPHHDFIGNYLFLSPPIAPTPPTAAPLSPTHPP